MVDWNAVTVTDVSELPGVARTGKDNPLYSHVESAAKDGKVKQLPALSNVKGDAVTDADGKAKTYKDGSKKFHPSDSDDAQRMLRRAADDLGKGIKVRVTTKGDKDTITFQVNERRKYERKNEKPAEKSAEKSAEKASQAPGNGVGTGASAAAGSQNATAAKPAQSQAGIRK